MTAIEVTGISKRFGSVTALESVDLAVEEGEVFGFLGPNGAGKSTLINILLNFVRPDSGRAAVFGHDCQSSPVAVKRRLGVVPEGYRLFEQLTGREHIEYAIEAKDADVTPGAVLDRVGIRSDADQQAGGYSTGMAHRLVLGTALVGKPDLLILDEPTTGLDPNGIMRIREIIREERERGAAVFFSSHILEQVEAVCDRIGILYQGQIITTGTIEDIRQAAGAETKLVVTTDRIDDGMVQAVRSIDGVDDVQLRPETTQLEVICTDGAKFAVLDSLRDAGTSIRNFETSAVSLEAMFAELTGGQS